MTTKKEYKTIEELIKQNLVTKEDAATLKLMKELKNVKKRCYFTKDEFLKMGMWKSHAQNNNISKIQKKK